MQNKSALVAGLLILVLIGLGIGWFVMNPPNPGDTPHDTTRTARSGDDRSSDKTAPTRDSTDDAPPENTTRTTPPDAVQKQAPPVEKAKPVIATISGKAIDYFEEPAAGVTLTLLPEAGETVTGPAVVTDELGQFRFETNLVPGEYFVACLEEGKALTATGAFEVTADKPVEGLVIRVYAAARVFGVVLNAADQQPLPEVNIRIDARTDARLQRLGRLLGRFKPVRSDEQGRYAVEGVAPGAYLVFAEKSGWTANELNPVTRGRQEVTLDEYSNVELLPFVLEQACIIEGYVLKKSDRSPVVGASVDVGTPFGGSFAATTTDEAGFYRLDTVPPTPAAVQGPANVLGQLDVRAVAPGLAMATRQLRIEVGTTRSDFNLLLEDGAVITGRVVNAKQEPVAGAQVYHNYNDALRELERVSGVGAPQKTAATTTAEDGSFTLGGLPVGNVQITAQAEGYSFGTAQATTTPGTTAEVTIVLQAEGWIEGVVTNDRGEPVSGVALAAYDVAARGEVAFVMKSLFGEVLPDRGESPMFPSTIRSGSDGAYRIPALAAANYIVVANTRRYQKHISAELGVKSGAGTVHNIQLTLGGTIFGRVYDSAGKPDVGVAVTGASLLGQDSARVRTSYTDSSGNYEMTGLSPGTYTVVRNEGDPSALFMPNAKNRVKVAAGERVQFDIYERKPGTARLYGRVTEDGVTYAEQSIVLIGGSRGGFSADRATTDAQGYYEFRGVPFGSYQIAQARGPFPSLVRRRVSVTREGDIEFDVEFITVKITGKVVLPGGEVPNGRVRVIASPVNPQAGDSGTDQEKVNELEMQVATEVTATPETGAYELTGLSPGFYRVTARSDNHGTVMRPYVNLRVTVNGLVLTLPGEGATLKGTVTGLDEAANNTPFGLIAALTVEDDKGQPVPLGGFDNGVNLTESKQFEVKNLPEGTFTVTLSLSGYTPITYNAVNLKNGETKALNFAFASSGHLKITLLNADIDITTAMGLEYEIRNSKGELFKKRFTFLDFFAQDGTAQQGEDNSFTIKDLPPESYTITMTLPEYQQVKREFTIIAGETAAITVEFMAE